MALSRRAVLVSTFAAFAMPASSHAIDLDYAAGWLTWPGGEARAACGRGGVRADKREGDGASPAGNFPLLQVYYRPDRLGPPQTGLPLIPLQPSHGWVDDPGDPNYNRLVTLPYPAHHEEMWRADGMALMELKDGQPVPTFKVHFGYTDGISMTTIRGGPERYPPDHQQPCAPWLFVLQEEAENYIVPEPRELGLNGSFAVFKMIVTDVVGFENFLQSNKDKIDPELLAAKICGRWRNGVPLALSPDTDSPPGGIALEELNNYEYVNADGSGDPKGLRCPVGAHMRRINPRGQPVTGQGEPGGSNNTHRLIRRGMPYGPVYDPKQPYDGIERGLLGYFINSSIENQYEFVLSQWVNDSEFAGAVRLPPRSKDPMIGAQEAAESIFAIPQANGAPPIKITGFSSFITTKAAAYCFLPSITAIKFISKLE